MMISAVFGALLALAAAEVPCLTRATIEGDPELTAELDALLLERGVRADSSCPAVEVQIRADDGGYRVTIQDPWGRTVERTAQSLSTVAALIVAWTERELVERAPVAAEIAAEIAAPEPPRSPPPAMGMVPIEMQAPPRADAASLMLISVAAEMGRDFSRDQIWRGARAGACARLGPTCLGGSLRYNNADGSHLVDVLIDVGLPLAFGRVAFEPKLGIGGGWAPLPEWSEVGLIIVPMTFEDHLGLRVETGLTASLDLFGDLRFQLGGSATFSFAGHSGQFESDGVTVRANAGLLWGAL